MSPCDHRTAAGGALAGALVGVLVAAGPPLGLSSVVAPAEDEADGGRTGPSVPSVVGACTLQPPHTVTRAVTRAAATAGTAIDLRIRMPEMFPPDDASRTDRHCGERDRNHRFARREA